MCKSNLNFAKHLFFEKTTCVYRLPSSHFVDNSTASPSLPQEAATLRVTFPRTLSARSWRRHLANATVVRIEKYTKVDHLVIFLLANFDLLVTTLI